ncbi:carbohydrate ABC transporter permease [Lentzea sp. NPDC005914]|uniref:carbohydrate ABC transporter permease n=1 Tax=Lentzea sp. NPDC005914 TaxID=3154572 RepID=UPI003401B7C1
MRSVVGFVLVAVYLLPVGVMVTYPTSEAWSSRILGDPQVFRYVLNSVVVASGTCLLTLVLAVPAAYALARLPLRGKPVLLLLMLSSLMFPAIMLATPLFVVFSRLGLTDTYAGLILADTTLALPYAIVLLRPAFAAVPREFGEAAVIDGCGAFGVFWRVILPLVLPGVATVAVLAFLWGWGDLVFALTLATDDEMRPVTTGLWGFFGATTSDWGGAMAFATVAMVPPLVVFLVSQRLVVAGVAAGGTKG